MASPAVSYVVPTRNEAEYLGRTLASIRTVRTEKRVELIVSDGASSDETRAIARENGATVLEGPADGIAAGRNRGARAARGDWIAFIDADTVVHPGHPDRMLDWAQRHDLDALTSRCYIPGLRGQLMQATINQLFSRLKRPILPGFNFFIRRSTFEETGGFPSVGNEDTEYSRRLGRTHNTGYCPDVLVTSSPRRIQQDGLTGTAVHYLRLDISRLRGQARLHSR